MMNSQRTEALLVYLSTAVDVRTPEFHCISPGPHMKEANNGRRRAYLYLVESDDRAVSIINRRNFPVDVK